MPSRKWRYSRNVAWRKVAGEAVILNVDTAVYHSLGGAGLRMWELLGQGKSSEAVGRILAEEYDAGAERILKDFDGLVRDLKKANLIEPA